MEPVLLATERLYPTKNDLSPAIRGQLTAMLNDHLADAIDLQTQAKMAHWNVKGPSFVALHKLFDEVHGAVAEYVDLIAERAVQLGGVAEGTARIAARRSNLDEYPCGIGAGSRHVEALSLALAACGTGMRRAIDEAAWLGDAGTADLFTEIARGIDKWLWFVEAHAQGEMS